MSDSPTFLPRHEWKPLRRVLAAIPALVDDLAVTLTHRDRVQKSRLGQPSRRRPESALPVHLGAADVSAELHNCLAGWVRLVCEQRQVEYMPIGYTHPRWFVGPLRTNERRLPDGYDIGATSTLARWLRTNIAALAMTEGSSEALHDIASSVDACRRVIDLPAEDDIVIDRARVDAANRQVLTAGQCEKIAPKLGELGKGLTKRRVETLNRAKILWPVVTLVKGDPKFYRLGNVLDAHHRHPQRKTREPNGRVDA